MKVGIVGAAIGGAGGVLSSLGLGISELGHSVTSIQPQDFTLRQQPFRNPKLTLAASIDNLILKNRSWPSLVSLMRDGVGASLSESLSELDLLIVRWANGAVRHKDWPVNLPVVWGLPDQNSFTGVCHYSGSCHEYKTGCQSCPALRAPFSFFSSSNLERKLSLYKSFRSIGFAAPSEWIAEQARKSLIGSFPISTIPNPIDSEFLLAPRQGKARDPLGKLKIGFVASNVLDPVKGFMEVSGVLEQAKSEGLVEVTTAGRISSSEQKRYPFFNHSGALSKLEMVDFYDQLDVVVVPSTQEAAGMVPLEAMARGVVPVVRATGGLKESITNDIGFLFNHPKELALILKSLSHSSLLERRVRGQLIAGQRSPKAVASRYLEFGRSLL